MRNSPRELVISFRGFDGLFNHWDIPMVSGSRRFAVLHLPIHLPRFRSRLVGNCLWQISWTKWFSRFCAPVQKIVLRISPVNVDISSRGNDGSCYHWDFPMVSDRHRVHLYGLHKPASILGRGWSCFLAQVACGSSYVVLLSVSCLVLHGTPVEQVGPRAVPDLAASRSWTM